jgi:hypothetical protein
MTDNPNVPSREVILEEAKRGNPDAIEPLRELLKREPELVEIFADLDRIIRNQLNSVAIPKDFRITEALESRHQALVEELNTAGSGTALEKLLIQRVLTCHRVLQVTELLLAASWKETPDAKQQMTFEQRVSQAAKRFEAAYDLWQKHARSLLARQNEKKQYSTVPESIRQRIHSTLVGAGVN